VGRGKSARTLGVLRKQTSKLAIVICALSIVLTGKELACAADSGGTSAPPAQTDAHVIGKHLYIDYAVSIEGGRVRRVDILAYRESYGGEVRSPSWLSQFVGKTSASPLKVGSDIRNISGATLSSMHVTEGVKRILAAYGHLR
jgi:FMN-binding domain